MPSFDLGIDSDDEPDGLGGLGLRGSKGLQRPGAVEKIFTGGLGKAGKGAQGEAESGLRRGVKTQCSEKSQAGEEQPRARAVPAQPPGRLPVAEGTQATPDKILPDTAAKPRNRLRKLSSGASDKETPSSNTPVPSSVRRAADAVDRSPNEMAAAFADSDEEDKALLSIDFRSAGKSRASNGLTPIRERGVEPGQGLGLGGWRTKGPPARESMDKSRVSDAETAKTSKEAELKRAIDRTVEDKYRPDTVPDRVDTELAQEAEKRDPDAGRCQSSAELPLDGLQTPPSGLLRKRDGLEKDSLGERRRVLPMRESDGIEGMVKRRSGLEPGTGSAREPDEDEARRAQKQVWWERTSFRIRRMTRSRTFHLRRQRRCQVRQNVILVCSGILFSDYRCT